MGKFLFCPYYCCGCCSLPDSLVWVLLHPNDCRKFSYYILIPKGLICLIWQYNDWRILESERISVKVRSSILRLSIVWREFMILWINCSDFQLCGCYLTRKSQMLLSRVVKGLEDFATQLFCPWECGVRLFPTELVSSICRHILFLQDYWENSRLDVELSLDVAPSSPIPECDLTLNIWTVRTHLPSVLQSRRCGLNHPNPNRQHIGSLISTIRSSFPLWCTSLVIDCKLSSTLRSICVVVGCSQAWSR